MTKKHAARQRHSHLKKGAAAPTKKIEAKSIFKSKTAVVNFLIAAAGVIAAFHPATAEPFQALRIKMESEWTPQMMEVLDIDSASLPIIWDADFLYGPRTASGEDTYVLCEINVSSVFAIPEQAPAAVCRHVKTWHSV